MDPSTSLPTTVTNALRALSLRQRAGLAVIGAALMGAMVWGATQSSSGLVPLSVGRNLTAAESRDIQTRLRTAGLTDFRLSEGQILVPGDRAREYTAVLTDDSPSSDNWAAEWERQNERLNPFSGTRARETGKEIARAKHITAMLRQLPDIEQADVVWDEDAQQGWKQPPRCRATVYLQPAAGRELSLDIVRAVRLAVAGSKKHLDPADVVIMDMARQVTYDGTETTLVGDQMLPQLRVLADLYRRQIADSLTDIDGAQVAVNVDLPKFFAFLTDTATKHRIEPADNNARLAANASGLLRVNVSFDPAATPTLPTAAARDDLQCSVHNRIAGLLDGSNGSSETGGVDAAQIVVSLPAVPLETPSTNDRTLAAALVAIPSPVRYGSGVLIVLMVLLMLVRRRGVQSSSTKQTPAAVESSPQPFEFEDLSRLDPHTLSALYSQEPSDCWAIALRGASDEVTQRLVAALATQPAEELRRQLDQLGPVRLREVQSSQNRIVHNLRQTSGPQPASAPGASL